MSQAPMPCPFCGEPPAVLPRDPKTEGDAWASVNCENLACPAKPRILDGVGVANDPRGSDAYKAAAVARWNDALVSSDVLTRASRLVAKLTAREREATVTERRSEHIT